MTPGAYLFVRDDGGEPWYAIVPNTQKVLFFRMDGARAHGRFSQMGIPVTMAHQFGRFIPLVAMVEPGVFNPRVRLRSSGSTGSPVKGQILHPKDRGHRPIQTRVRRFEPWNGKAGNGVVGFSGPNGIYAALDAPPGGNHHP